MFKSRLTLLFFILSLVLSPGLRATDEIDLSFENEIGLFFGSYPQTGAWFAADGSNTGFFLDIQDRVLAGAYFGFDNQGNNVWFTFTGTLEPGFSIGYPINWFFRAPLTQGANGGCILDCASSTAEQHDSMEVGEISIGFSGRNRAAVSINNNEVIPIIPLYFGTSAMVSNVPGNPTTFAEPLLLAVPDLQGQWVVATGFAISDSENVISEVEFADTSGVIQIGEQQIDTQASGASLPAGVTRIVRWPITRDNFGLFPENSEIACSFTQRLESPDFPVFRDLIDCQIGPDGTDASTDSIQINVPVTSISDSRFLVFMSTLSETEESLRTTHRFEAFRVGYD